MQLGGRADVALPEVAPGDLDVAVVGQLPAADLPLAISSSRVRCTKVPVM